MQPFSAQVTPHETVVDLQQFTIDFFTFWGATITQQGRKKQQRYLVKLPESLVSHFGQPTLQLCFRSAELEPGWELLTPGSRIFDRMMSLLDERGAMSHLRLPAHHSGGERLLRAIHPVNASIANLRMQEEQQYWVLFQWRITYRADDKREELYTIILDEQGNRLPKVGEVQAGATAVDLDQVLRDAEPVLPEQNEMGQPLPARLPPMTHLMRLAESARKYAIYHADLRCVGYEAEILPRLYKTLNRLTAYYQQQMEETYDAHDPDGEKRSTLELDLQRKVAEEVENHRLRVDVHLISYAILQAPVATAEVTLYTGGQETSLRVALNRYTGQLHRPHCQSCNQETTKIAIDRHGHITCDDCLHQCATCQEILCEQCGVAPCPVCQQENCDTCGRLCWACGERACAEHSGQCPICSDEVCYACQAECAHCGTRQCRSHLRADHVAAGRSQVELICATCAVRCPGCQQYSRHTGLCSTSGQRFCEECLGTCTRCGNHFGPGFFHTIDGWSYCTNCLETCPQCQAYTPTAEVCGECGTACCAACGDVCDHCQQRFCQAHIHRSDICEHRLCAAHSAHCHCCEQPVCPLCEPVCGICERPFCAADASTCAFCGQSYCRECVRRSGLCDTCATASRTSQRVAIMEEPGIADPKLAKVIRNFHWSRTGNQRYTIYIGDGTLATQMVVVMDKLHDPPKVVQIRKSPPLEALLRKLWR